LNKQHSATNALEMLVRCCKSKQFLKDQDRTKRDMNQDYFSKLFKLGIWMEQILWWVS